MIHTVYSNSYEVLKTVLMHNIENLRFVDKPVPHEKLFATAFEKVPVVIPSLAVEEDLKRSIAERDGIYAGIDCMLLGRWLGLFSRDLTNLVGPEAAWMIWRLLSEKGPGSLRETYPRLQHYLEGKDDVAVYRLAARVAQKFMTYASYRFDWILEWVGVYAEMLPKGPEHDHEKAMLERHPDFRWQKELWQRLYNAPGWSGTDFIKDFPNVLKQFAATGDAASFQQEEWAAKVELSESLHIFAPIVVPPLMLPIIKAFAKPGRNVWLYLLNPTDQYWYDLIPRSLMNWDNADSHTDAVHPILADNARSTRANLDRLWRFTQGPDTAGEENPSLLSELDADPYEPDLKPAAIVRKTNKEWEAYAGRHQDLKVENDVDVQNYFLEARDPKLLRRIQDSVLDLDPDLKKGNPHESIFKAEDDSLLFMRAPTATRELENLADWLQSLFMKHPDLKPDDVLVVTPDISGATPLIDKVFGSLPAERRLPWTVTGARPVDSDPAAQGVLMLLRLLAGRADILSLIEWVSVPIVGERYGFSVSDIAVMNDWLVQAGYRFGLSEAHLKRIEEEDGLPELNESMHDMSLERALERLTLGFMLPDDVKSPWGDTLPVEGTENGTWVGVNDRPRLLEGLSELALKLERHRLKTVSEKTIEEWRSWFSDMLADFFPPEYDRVNFSTVRTGVNALAADVKQAAGGEETDWTLPYSLFVEALSGKLKETPTSGRGSNGITFSGMTQMRNIPYRVIAVIGLNADSAFPGTSNREEFDLMAVEPRRGDRDSRIDNRNVFLDLLLAARDNLMISFVTGTGTDADERQPSIVAQELFAWLLDFAGGVEEGEPGFDRRTLAAHLMRKVPLTGYSPDNFREDERGWSGTDNAMLDALKTAIDEHYSAELPAFSVSQGRDPLGGRTEIPFDELMRFWRKPTSNLLKQLNIRLPSKIEDRSFDLLPPSGGLASWLRKREVWESSGDEDEIARLIRRWSVDPSLGAVGVRDWAGVDDIEVVKATRRKFEEMPATNQLTALPEETYSYRHSNKFAVRMTSGDLYRMPAKKSKQKGLAKDASDRIVMLRHVASKLTVGNLSPLLFEYLLYSASHPADAVELHVVFYDKDAKCWPIFGFDSWSADRMLGALIEAYADMQNDVVQMPECTGPGGFGNYQPDLRSDTMVMRGRDLQTLWRLRADLNDALMAMKGQRPHPDPVETADAFVEAFEKLRETAHNAVDTELVDELSEAEE